MIFERGRIEKPKFPRLNSRNFLKAFVVMYGLMFPMAPSHAKVGNDIRSPYLIYNLSQDEISDLIENRVGPDSVDEYKRNGYEPRLFFDLIKKGFSIDLLNRLKYFFNSRGVDISEYVHEIDRLYELQQLLGTSQKVFFIIIDFYLEQLKPNPIRAGEFADRFLALSNSFKKINIKQKLSLLKLLIENGLFHRTESDYLLHKVDSSVKFVAEVRRVHQLGLGFFYGGSIVIHAEKSNLPLREIKELLEKYPKHSEIIEEFILSNVKSEYDLQKLSRFLLVFSEKGNQQIFILDKNLLKEKFVDFYKKFSDLHESMESQIVFDLLHIADIDDESKVAELYEFTKSYLDFFRKNEKVLGFSENQEFYLSKIKMLHKFGLSPQEITKLLPLMESDMTRAMHFFYEYNISRIKSVLQYEKKLQELIILLNDKPGKELVQILKLVNMPGMDLAIKKEILLSHDNYNAFDWSILNREYPDLALAVFLKLYYKYPGLDIITLCEATRLDLNDDMLEEVIELTKEYKITDIQKTLGLLQIVKSSKFPLKEYIPFLKLPLTMRYINLLIFLGITKNDVEYFIENSNHNSGIYFDKFIEEILNNSEKSAKLDPKKISFVRENKLSFISRYPIEVLIGMFNNYEGRNKPRTLFLLTQNDHNGAFSYNDQMGRLIPGTNVYVNEVESDLDLASGIKRFLELTKNDVERPTIIIGGHGSTGTINFSNNKSADSNLDLTDARKFDITADLVRGVTIILQSCSAGKGEQNIAQFLADTLGAKVIAPDKDTNFKSLEVVNGGIFVTYNDAETRTFLPQK